MEEYDRECSYCLEQLSAPVGGEGLLRTPCNHLFHQTCLFHWFSNGVPGDCCPLCQTKMLRTDPIPIPQPQPLRRSARIKVSTSGRSASRTRSREYPSTLSNGSRPTLPSFSSNHQASSGSTTTLRRPPAFPQRPLPVGQWLLQSSQLLEPDQHPVPQEIERPFHALPSSLATSGMAGIQSNLPAFSSGNPPTSSSSHQASFGNATRTAPTSRSSRRPPTTSSGRTIAGTMPASGSTDIQRANPRSTANLDTLNRNFQNGRYTIQSNGNPSTSSSGSPPTSSSNHQPSIGNATRTAPTSRSSRRPPAATSRVSRAAPRFSSARRRYWSSRQAFRAPHSIIIPSAATSFDVNHQTGWNTDWNRFIQQGSSVSVRKNYSTYEKEEVFQNGRRVSKQTKEVARRTKMSSYQMDRSNNWVPVNDNLHLEQFYILG